MNKLCLVLLIAACGNKSKGVTPPEPAPPDAGATAVEPPQDGPLAAELAAYQAAEPVFDAACARCHTKDGEKASAKKLEHFDMTTYPFGGHHTATITTTLRHVLGIDGAKPKMPADKPGSVSGDDLALIAAWADAYDAAEQAGAHEGVSGYTPAE
jgi:mono/diheme cytochrome c family protein